MEAPCSYGSCRALDCRAVLASLGFLEALSLGAFKGDPCPPCGHSCRGTGRNCTPPHGPSREAPPWQRSTVGSQCSRLGCNRQPGQGRLLLRPKGEREYQRPGALRTPAAYVPLLGPGASCAPITPAHAPRRNDRRAGRPVRGLGSPPTSCSAPRCPGCRCPRIGPRTRPLSGLLAPVTAVVVTELLSVLRHRSDEHLVELGLIHIVVLLRYNGKIGGGHSRRSCCRSGDSSCPGRSRRSLRHLLRNWCCPRWCTPASGHLLHDAGVIHGLAAVFRDWRSRCIRPPSPSWLGRAGFILLQNRRCG